jgi:hypothetical protein
MVLLFKAAEDFRGVHSGVHGELAESSTRFSSDGPDQGSLSTSALAGQDDQPTELDSLEHRLGDVKVLVTDRSGRGGITSPSSRSMPNLHPGGSEERHGTEVRHAGLKDPLKDRLDRITIRLISEPLEVDHAQELGGVMRELQAVPGIEDAEPPEEIPQVEFPRTSFPPNRPVNGSCDPDLLVESNELLDDFDGHGVELLADEQEVVRCVFLKIHLGEPVEKRLW